MFNTQHILYMVISFALTIVGLILCSRFIKDEKKKQIVLKVSAILTVIIHYSVLYVDFFKTGRAEVEAPQLLPIYPCNVLMWLLVVCAFIKDTKTKFSKLLFEFTFYAGVLCGIIGIVLNENYGHNPTLANYFSLHGLLSHSTMVFGCLYILVGKFIRIDTSNCISVFAGLCLFLVDGFVVNGLYKVFGLGDCNSMYLQEPPLPNAPWLNTYLMGIIGLAIVFIITLIVEQFTLKKEDRLFERIKTFAKNNKERKNSKDAKGETI